ncbi:hypothetical protein GLE_2280 [Lysobacter enzymogenes]|uniref:Uncharacterized protein n=1 Tax=Lysobacter enzymogenes TaxID=69 RepID=A0A0S2DGU1_LYSEN|nr:hypothetical protein GLE_2280 [Lysobacter enzymogenes]
MVIDDNDVHSTVPVVRPPPAAAGLRAYSAAPCRGSRRKSRHTLRGPAFT